VSGSHDPQALLAAPASGPTGPTVRDFAIVGGFEAVVRGTTLSVYPLALYRQWQDAVAVSQAYLVVGVASLLAVLAMPLLARHVPRRWLHTVAVALYATSALLGIAGGALVVAALLCTGLGTAIAFVCYNNNVLDHVPKDQLGRLESLRMFCAGPGWAAGPLLGVWLHGLWAGAPFVLTGTAAVGMLAAIWWTGMGSRRLGAVRATVSANPLRYLGRFLGRPELVGGWFMLVVRSYGWSIYMVYVGIFAIQAGLGERVGGLTASLASCGLFFTPLMLRWIRRRPLRAAVRIGFLVSGLCFVGASLVSGLPWLSIALLLLGAAFLLLLDLCGALPFQLSVRPSERAEMSAIHGTVRDVSNLLTPAVVWLVLLVGPMPAVFAAGGAGLLAAWMVAGRMHPNLGVPVRERQRARARPG
jgi:ACDE family multidrug resistance protein